MSEQTTPPWLSEVVSDFGVACKEKLAGPGDREAAIATKDDLADVGVEWPTTKKDHAPRRQGMSGGTARRRHGLVT